MYYLSSLPWLTHSSLLSSSLLLSLPPPHVTQLSVNRGIERPSDITGVIVVIISVICHYSHRHCRRLTYRQWRGSWRICYLGRCWNFHMVMMSQVYHLMRETKGFCKNLPKGFTAFGEGCIKGYSAAWRPQNEPESSLNYNFIRQDYRFLCGILDAFCRRCWALAGEEYRDDLVSSPAPALTECRIIWRLF